MAVYAVGDVQGCYDPLRRLLDQLSFDPSCDRLWLVGDLVNRGPASLATLRFIRQLGDAAVTVLGNHDLHLLAVAHRRDRYRRKDTFNDILAAPDGEELLHWLRYRPLLHRDAQLQTTMVHAGLPPQWDLPLAQACAEELAAVLRSEEGDAFLAQMYGNKPDHWSSTLAGWDRLRFTCNCLTRMRFCTSDGRLDLEHKGAPGSQPAYLFPWYQVPGHRSVKETLVFGHWSTLGYLHHGRVHALDSGCVWGGFLTALRLDGSHLPYQIRCPGALVPGDVDHTG